MGDSGSGPIGPHVRRPRRRNGPAWLSPSEGGLPGSTAYVCSAHKSGLTVRRAPPGFLAARSSQPWPLSPRGVQGARRAVCCLHRSHGRGSRGRTAFKDGPFHAHKDLGGAEGPPGAPCAARPRATKPPPGSHTPLACRVPAVAVAAAAARVRRLMRQSLPHVPGHGTARPKWHGAARPQRPATQRGWQTCPASLRGGGQTYPAPRKRTRTGETTETSTDAPRALTLPLRRRSKQSSARQGTPSR